MPWVKENHCPLPRLSDSALSTLLQAAHQVDGIVKGLKQPDWPANPWQALARLATMLCGLCAAAPNKVGVGQARQA